MVPELPPPKRPIVIRLHLLAASALLSVVMCSVAVAITIRSLYVEDFTTVGYAWYPNNSALSARWFSIKTFRGDVQFGGVRNDLDVLDARELKELRRGIPGGWQGSYLKLADGSDEQPSSLSLPLYKHDDQPSSHRHDEYWYLTLPVWYAIPLCVPLPAVYVYRRVRRMRRLRRGCCGTCGYNLRFGTGRCPECGNINQSCRAGTARRN